MATRTAKRTKKTAQKVNFTKSVNSVKKSAKTVNKEMKGTADDVIKDIKATADVLTDAASKTVKETLDKVNFLDGKKLKNAAKSANEFTLETAEDIIDGILVSSEKWQGVAHKALKGGMKLSANQQDIVFTALEDAKGQVINGVSRIKKLFSTK